MVRALGSARSAVSAINFRALSRLAGSLELPSDADQADGDAAALEIQLVRSSRMRKSSEDALVDQLGEVSVSPSYLPGSLRPSRSWRSQCAEGGSSSRASSRTLRMASAYARCGSCGQVPSRVRRGIGGVTFR